MTSNQEIVAVELAMVRPGERVVAAFEMPNGDTYQVVGVLRENSHGALLVGGDVLRGSNGNLGHGLRSIGPADRNTVPPVGFRENVARVLIEHQRFDSGKCLCGWDELGRSHADHVAKVLHQQDVVRDAYRFLREAEAVFDRMAHSPDWEGQVSMGFAATYAQEFDMLIEQYGPTPNAYLAAISAWIDDSDRYQEADAGLVDTWRVVKLIEEVGEAVSALMGAMGENPRKGVTHSRADVERELYDVAAAALGAIMHGRRNDPRADVLGDLIGHLRGRAVRAVPHGLVMPGPARQERIR